MINIIKVFSSILSFNVNKSINTDSIVKIIFIYLCAFLIFYVIIDFFFFKEKIKDPVAWEWIVSRVPDKLDYLIYLVSFTVLPIITFKIFNLNHNNQTYFNFSFVSVSSLTLLLFFDIFLFQIDVKINLINSLSIFYCAISGILSLLLPPPATPKKKIKKYLNNKLLEFSICLIFLNILLYKPFYRFGVSVSKNFYLNIFKDEFYLLKFFSIIIFFSVFFYLIGKIKVKNISYKSLILFIPAFIFVSLNENFYNVDLHHYIPYIGPSLFANQGGLIGIDAFSQYGMGVSYLNFIYFKFAPNTFFSFGVLVRIINFLCFILIILIIIRISQNKFFSLIGGLIIIIFQDTMDFDMNSHPSTFGTRYLLPLLITYIISNSKYLKRKFNIFILSILYAISSLWSIECFIFSSVIIFGNIIAKSIYYHNLKQFYFALKSLFIAIILFHLLINVYYFSISRSFLDYYTLLFLPIMGGRISTSPQMQDFLSWLPLLVVYSVIFIKYVEMVCQKYSKNPGLLKNVNFEKFTSSYLNLAMLGVIIGIYYVNRSVPKNIFPLYFPLMIIIYKLLEDTVPKLLAKKKIFIFFSIVSLISFLFTNSLYNLNKKKHPNEIDKFTLLENCLKKNCDIKNYINSKKIILGSTVFEANIANYRQEYEEIFQEALDFKKKYFSKNNRNLIFISTGHMPLSEMLFMETKSWYFHPISWIYTDYILKKNEERILSFNKYILENSYIMFYDLDELFYFEKKIVESIKKEFKLCLVERGKKNISVYILKNNNMICNA
jgi:hypothetical protein